MSRVVAPLTGTVTTGTWVTDQRLNVAAMPNGFISYHYLLPAQYNPSGSTTYPVLFHGHENDEGMNNGGSYPASGSSLVGGGSEPDSAYNTVAFRTAFPCIVVVPACDQSLDQSGANGNANFGGYADTPNSGGNEQGINALAGWVKANLKADPTAFLCTGSSLGAIGTLAWLVDNNTLNGTNKIWAGGMGLSDQLYRPTIPNANVFPAMQQVPYIAISTPNDNNPQIYDQAAWQAYTGNTNYPTPASYSSGGVAALRAPGTQFYYMDTTTGVPWPTYRQLNADGGNATALYNLLFSFLPNSSQGNPPVPSITVITPGSGSLTDGSGGVWTISSVASGSAVELNGTAVAGGAGTSEFCITTAGVYWGLDPSGPTWYTYSGGLNGNWTSQGTAKPPVVPNQPAGLAHGTVTNTSVPLSWSAALLATSYTIEMSTNGGAFSTIGTSTGTSYTATGLTAGTNYAFQVAGVDSTGTSAYSTPVSATTTGGLTAPGAPTGLTVGTISTTSVALSWTAPTTGGAASGYTIFSRTPSGSGTFAQIGTSTTTSFTATGLSSSTSYDFEVFATNSAGTSPASSSVSATTSAAVTVPGAPTGLTVGTVTSTSVALSWTAPTTGSPATGYTILDRTPSGSGTFASAGTSTTTSFTVTGLTASTSYDFEVEATNSAGTGAASSSVSATTSAAVTVATVQAQITQAESLVAQLNTDLSSIYSNVGLL